MSAHFKAHYAQEERMKTDVEFECAYCGAANSAPLDPVDGVQEWTTDCERCCQPVTIRINAKSGEVLDVECRMESE
jgi:hypothetical protein